MERKILVKANSEHLLRGFPKSCKYSTEYQPTDRKSLDQNSPFFFFYCSWVIYHLGLLWFFLLLSTIPDFHAVCYFHASAYN